MRSEQAFIIDRFIREQKIPANEPVFVAGDLNVDYYVPAQYRSLVLGGLKCNNPFERELERMRTRNDHNSLRHTCDFERNEFMKLGTLSSDDACELVDYILVREDHWQPHTVKMAVKRLLADAPYEHRGKWFRELSDHFAVWGEFTFRKSG